MIAFAYCYFLLIYCHFGVHVEFFNGEVLWTSFVECLVGVAKTFFEGDILCASNGVLEMLDVHATKSPYFWISTIASSFAIMDAS